MAIKIFPFGEIDGFILDYLKENLSEIFDAEIYSGQPQPLPKYAFNKKRGQYLSSVILENFKTNKLRNQKILAIIDKDLYVPELNFVFGQANSQNGICIISITRLHQTYFGFPENKYLFLNRILKEAVHEIGHLLNLGHCPNPKCVMHFSNSLLDTDRKDYYFCDRCKGLLP